MNRQQNQQRLEELASRIACAKDLIRLKNNPGWKRVKKFCQRERKSLADSLIHAEFEPNIHLEFRAAARILDWLMAVSEKDIDELEALEAQVEKLQSRLAELDKLDINEELPPGAKEFFDSFPGPQQRTTR